MGRSQVGGSWGAYATQDRRQESGKVNLTIPVEAIRGYTTERGTDMERLICTEIGCTDHGLPCAEGGHVGEAQRDDVRTTARGRVGPAGGAATSRLRRRGGWAPRITPRPPARAAAPDPLGARPSRPPHSSPPSRYAAPGTAPGTSPVTRWCGWYSCRRWAATPSPPPDVGSSLLDGTAGQDRHAVPGADP